MPSPTFPVALQCSSTPARQDGLELPPIGARRLPAVPPYIIEPIWEQFSALLPKRNVDHPLGCHRARIPDRLVFEKLVQVLVFGCAYEKIAGEGCSATTLRRRRE